MLKLQQIDSWSPMNGDLVYSPIKLKCNNYVRRWRLIAWEIFRLHSCQSNWKILTDLFLVSGGGGGGDDGGGSRRYPDPTY